MYTLGGKLKILTFDTVGSYSDRVILFVVLFIVTFQRILRLTFTVFLIRLEATQLLSA